MKIADLTKMLGVCSLKDILGLWQYRIDKNWDISINGHTEEMEGIPPFHCLIKYNGWVAGLISPYGGEIVYSDVANEDTFIEAVNAVLLKKKEVK